MTVAMIVTNFRAFNGAKNVFVDLRCFKMF